MIQRKILGVPLCCGLYLFASSWLLLDQNSWANNCSSTALATNGASNRSKVYVNVKIESGISMRQQRTEKLLKQLRHADPDIRRAAADQLGDLQNVDTMAALIPLLTDQDISVRRAVSRALGKLLVKKIAPEPLTLLKGSVNQLSPLLRHPDPKIRRVTADQLGDLQAVDTAAALIPLLTDQDNSVRQAAGRALGKLRAKKTSPELLTLIDNSVKQLTPLLFTRITVGMILHGQPSIGFFYLSI